MKPEISGWSNRLEGSFLDSPFLFLPSLQFPPSADLGSSPYSAPLREAYVVAEIQMKDAAEIAQRLKILAADLLQLKRDSVAAGINPVDVLNIEDAERALENLAGRLTGK
jgi:hypothetical protein